MKVDVDELCDKPDELWDKYIQEGRVCEPASLPKVVSITDIIDVNVMIDHCESRLWKAIKKDAVRFVCISDTHDQLDRIVGRSLAHKYKIVIAGNHDLGFEDNEDLSGRGRCYRDRGTPQGYKLLTNCVYLQDSEVTVYGIRIYGSSWHPLAGYSFSRNRGKDLLEKWDLIPDGIDVLITHTPPLGHLDNFKGTRWGCSELLNTIERRVQPRFHVFGHVHEQNGATTNRKTTFINASICNHALQTAYGMRIYGAPWHPLAGYSFSRNRGKDLLEKWDLIPDGIDVLITHTPPLDHSLRLPTSLKLLKGTHCGCSELLNTIERRVQPRFHVFGHVHEQNGA
ncbi:unnamed protein product, partial [Anisakis simplex]|uniref:UPF0046 protein (inferred by orthology to a C. elegans protein) n=1 Tax=Anisakis simplex TaxID=6269 RepID=A0A0M3K3Z4_ANISI